MLERVQIYIPQSNPKVYTFYREKFSFSFQLRENDLKPYFSFFMKSNQSFFTEPRRDNSAIDMEFGKPKVLSDRADLECKTGSDGAWMMKDERCPICPLGVVQRGIRFNEPT